MPTTMLEPIRVEARGLSKTYASRPVIDGLTFSLEPGTITAFLGRNGAGKSTTVRRLAGLTPGGGTVTYGGSPLLEHAAPYRVLGLDLGTGQAHPGRTVRNHLRMLARHVPDGNRRMAEVVELLGVEPLLPQRPRRFSTGMRRSVALAGVLLADPSVLVLDEPINGLEVAAVQRVKHLLRAHAARGGTVLVASHVLAEVERLADRVLVLEDGRIAADGPLDEYLARHRAAEVEIRVDGTGRLLAALDSRGWAAREEAPGVVVVSGQDTAAVASLVRDLGLLVLGFAERRATLEEAFLGKHGGRGAERAPSQGLSTSVEEVR